MITRSFSSPRKATRLSAPLLSTNVSAPSSSRASAFLMHSRTVSSGSGASRLAAPASGSAASVCGGGAAVAVAAAAAAAFFLRAALYLRIRFCIRSIEGPSPGAPRVPTARSILLASSALATVSARIGSNSAATLKRCSSSYV